MTTVRMRIDVHWQLSPSARPRHHGGLQGSVDHWFEASKCTGVKQVQTRSVAMSKRCTISPDHHHHEARQVNISPWCVFSSFNLTPEPTFPIFLWKSSEYMSLMLIFFDSLHQVLDEIEQRDRHHRAQERICRPRDYHWCVLSFS